MTNKRRDTLLDMLQEFLANITERARLFIMRRVMRVEIGRELAIEVLKQIAAFPCSCREYVGHNGCPSCLARGVLMDPTLKQEEPPKQLN